MEVAMPMSGTAIDCYEDMFKEITRKLYGEDGLPELTGTERLPTSQERGLTPIDYDVDNPILKPEEHLTAFGLAALMQNGFPTTGILNSTFQQHKTTTTSVEDKWTANEDSLQWTQSKIATYNPSQKLFRCAECDCVGYLPRVAEHWLGTHSNLRAFQCPQCPYESAWARCVRMHLSRQHNINTDESSDTLIKSNPVLQEITKYLQRLKNKLESNYSKPHTSNSQILEDFQSATNSTNNHLTGQVVTTNSETNGSSKRYTCTYCPYATDRRDLFTRHENIHREEKPFQCYVCQKQFNRADHVKKHFLRMHREHPYDLNRIRRHPPKNASGMSYYQKYNANSTNQSPDSISSLANINSLSIPNGFNNMSRSSTNIRPGNNTDMKNGITNVKSGNISKSNGKKKGEKRFSCCYCSWSGVDNWCLKRHMNTHLKPFVCGLCDYKAARSERLATHVLKVHNKRACGKCSFLADDPAQLTVHQQEHHPLEQRNRSGNNILRNTSFNNGTGASSSSCSDGSEPESESRGAEDMSRLNLNHRIQSDFLEAGDVGSQADEEEGEEMELPLFVCPTCGCEFEDDMSLETHQYTHRHSTTSPAKSDYSKENVNPNLKYRCRLCDFAFESQSSVMAHMVSHSSLTTGAQVAKSNLTKRPRKQSRPKKMVLPFWDLNEVEVLRHLNGNLSELQQASSSTRMEVSKKYMAKIVAGKGLYCVLCKSSSVNRYHTKGTLALHYFWKHLNKRFKCEHCDLHFRHRYQCVLHASRDHINKPPILKSQTVPIKEPIHSAVPASQDAHHFFTNSQTVTVPDASTNAHKLGMSFFDHSFIHPTNPINSHMPIIIPTFPPN
ncbi:zinc finger protein Xfin-like [Asbolus verrucosus]|uniref:Zinc finger protein Xfin-like n=1 Tax=Asbolus verrucosus TaxID=1661398 RepID=A0A482W9P0_ASBVE|nr:zinc finger protein Xfin-like [Asbolus verrucosus]